MYIWHVEICWHMYVACISDARDISGFHEFTYGCEMPSWMTALAGCLNTIPMLLTLGC